MPTEPLPLSVDDVTAEWLTAALASGGAEVVVSAIATREIVWGTATKILLDVTYTAGGERFPSRLCVKGGFVPELLAIMAPGYQGEARFYRDIAPKLGDELVACHYAGVDADSGQGIVVLDDLSTGGAHFCDARQPLSVDEAAAALELLAGWHARTDLDAPWLDGPPHFRPMVAGILVADHWDAYIGQTTSGPVQEVLTDRERTIRAMTAAAAAADARPMTFAHGDANLTNVYLDAAGAPRFLDWQFACRTDPYHDVALFLIGALSTGDRRAHEEALIRAYLAARGDGAGSFDDAWHAYRTEVLQGVMYALTPEEMQPSDVRAALADRYAQAAIDLDTLALLGI